MSTEVIYSRCFFARCYTGLFLWETFVMYCSFSLQKEQCVVSRREGWESSMLGMKIKRHLKSQVPYFINDGTSLRSHGSSDKIKIIACN